MLSLQTVQYFNSGFYSSYKKMDFFYKTNKKFMPFQEPKLISVNVSVTFRNIKLTSKFTNTVLGLGFQFFLARFGICKFEFGFKTKFNFTSFYTEKSNFFNFISFFFFANFVEKAFSIGLFDSINPKFVTSKFCVTDLFNFFGVKFFSRFYLDFFDWPGKVIFGFKFPVCFAYFNPVIFSMFKIKLIIKIILYVSY